uniref:Ferredoxin-thioredoxin reductase, catalytic chain n=1 Tax=Platysiphonia delicata TaxID=2006979 RepID=A0A1Z1M0D1_9FLOR|nr:ferredoxin thioreductase subunit b [Platysiphonia delicata]ARW59527.1 ferredoxin thioreductase subunit b [Platysiphonia delicata]
MDNITNLNKDLPKSFELMCKFAQAYAEKTDTYFCLDLSVTAVVIEGLANHKDVYGAPLCPCRHYDSKIKEVSNAYWNCPCVPMRERKECHCMLFLTEENEFAGNNQQIESHKLLNFINK